MSNSASPYDICFFRGTDVFLWRNLLAVHPVSEQELLAGCAFARTHSWIIVRLPVHEYESYCLPVLPTRRRKFTNKEQVVRFY